VKQPARENGEQIVEFPALRRQAIDWLELERHKHLMYGLIEVDVTDTRRAIQEYRSRTGVPLTLTAYLIGCMARAIAEDRAMQAYRLGRNRLVLFDDVDVATLIERELHGRKLPVPYVLRAANARSFDQIAWELVQARSMDAGAIGFASLPRWLRAHADWGLSLWLTLPAAVRSMSWRWAVSDPYRRKQLTGTVALSAVGMFGSGMGWGIAPMAHTLSLVVGGMATRPRLVGSLVEPRDILCLTLIMDHDVIDGAPAARFSARLTQLIESAHQLGAESEEPSASLKR
jgi:hypothetical protein